MSHPTWVCGLKHTRHFLLQQRQQVTPYVGVWIETSLDNVHLSHEEVTPYVGVWIETIIYYCLIFYHLSHPTWVCGLKQMEVFINQLLNVTPYVGVWIETACNMIRKTRCSVTPYVGVWIETLVGKEVIGLGLSHPTWVCGLKLPKAIAARSESLVTPYVGVWIETSMAQYSAISKMVTPCVGIYGLEHCSLVGQVYGRTVSIRPLMYFSPGF